MRQGSGPTELPLDWRNLVLHGHQNRIATPALPEPVLCALRKLLNLSESSF